MPLFIGLHTAGFYTNALKNLFKIEFINFLLLDSTVGLG